MKKPKKCPFCGKRTKIEKVEDLTGPLTFTKFNVFCENYQCKVKPRLTTYGALNEAIEDWNRRASK